MITSFFECSRVSFKFNWPDSALAYVVDVLTSHHTSIGCTTHLHTSQEQRHVCIGPRTCGRMCPLQGTAHINVHPIEFAHHTPLISMIHTSTRCEFGRCVVESQASLPFDSFQSASLFAPCRVHFSLVMSCLPSPAYLLFSRR